MKDNKSPGVDGEKGSRNKSVNYRPVSLTLTSVMCKVLENI